MKSDPYSTESLQYRSLRFGIGWEFICPEALYMYAVNEYTNVRARLPWISYMHIINILNYLKYLSYL